MESAPLARRRLAVLGGSLSHPGGLESFCERAVAAVNRESDGWDAEWRPTESAYFTHRRWTHVRRAWRDAARLDGVDLVWLQWSNLTDLLFLLRMRSGGVPVMVTPHLGARSRLQRFGALRRIATFLLRRADRLALLFDGQEAEIALPATVPRSIIGTFLPEQALSAPTLPRSGDCLRLIHAGRLSAEKGTFRMVELCAALRKREFPIAAQIVGRADPAVMTALTAAIQQAGLERFVALTEWMDGPGLREALGRADVLVHLSELDSFPLIVMEALAAGALPVVAEMAGAAAMVRRYDGFVTPGSSVAAAADWLTREGVQALRSRAAVASVAVRGEHAWETIVRRLEQAADATLNVVAGTR